MDMPKSKPVISKENFLCVECGSTFIHHASLLRHRLRFHILGHKCCLCQTELRMSNSEVGGFFDLKKHMLEAHEISNVYSCGCCCFIFSNKSSLHMHCKSMNTSGLPGPAEPIATLLTDVHNAPEESKKIDEDTETKENKVSTPLNKKKTARRSSGPRPKRTSTNSLSSDSMLNNIYSYLTTLNQSSNSETGEETILQSNQSPVSSVNCSEVESNEVEKSSEGVKTDSSDQTNPDNAQVTNEIMEILAKHLEKSNKVPKVGSSELLHCRDCGATYTNKSSLYRHSIKAHLEAHTCCICDEEIFVSGTDGSDNMMRRHMLTLHNINNVYTCSCCFWAFDNKKDLYNHNYNMSTLGKPGDSRKIATSRKKQVSASIDEEVLTRSFTEDFLKLFNNELNNIFNDFNHNDGDEESKKNIELEKPEEGIKTEEDVKTEVDEKTEESAEFKKVVKIEEAGKIEGVVKTGKALEANFIKTEEALEAQVVKTKEVTPASSVLSEHRSDSESPEGLDVAISEDDEVSSKEDSASLRVSENEGSLKRPDLKGQFCCLDCGKFFCHSASLHRHRAKSHPSDFECLLCNFVIKNAKSVKEHMLSEHQISAAPGCWCCGWYFENKKLLKLHVQNMKTSGDTQDVMPIAKSSAGSRAPVNKKKKTSKSSASESSGVKNSGSKSPKDFNDFSSFVALFCPEVADEGDVSEGQSSNREESPLQTETNWIENDDSSKGKSLSPQLNAESFSSSKNDVTATSSPSAMCESIRKRSNKRRINDIASVLMLKKLKTSEA